MHFLKDHVLPGINDEQGFLLFVLICILCRVFAKIVWNNCTAQYMLTAISV